LFVGESRDSVGAWLDNGNNHRGGRPTKYTEALAAEILRRMAAGQSSGQACVELGLHRTTAALWRGAHPEFRTAYIEAFAARCYGFAEEAIAILDACPKNADMARVQRERHRADLRKFFATRLVPMLRDVPLVAEGATINLYLPRKGSDGDGGRLIEGSATQVLTDDSESS
jgi:hypothetical protein